MASIQIKSKISINDLLTSVEQLSGQELDKVIKKLLTLRVKQQITQSPKLETQLIKKINKKLSKTKQLKYEQLTKKRLAETLTEKEHVELSVLIDSIEKIEVEKLQAIFTLSQIKGISPTKLVASLKTPPQVNA